MMGVREIKWKEAIRIIRCSGVVDDDRESTWDCRPCHVVDLEDGRSIAFVSDATHDPGFSDMTPSDFSVHLPKCFLFGPEESAHYLGKGH